MKSKIIKLVISTILIITGCVVMFIYYPITTDIIVKGEKSKIAETPIEDIPDIILPVSTEDYEAGKENSNFTPYTLKENAVLTSSSYSYDTVISNVLDRYLECKFEADKALYHSIGTLKTTTAKVEETKNTIKEVILTFDIETFVAKDTLYVKYNQWEYEFRNHGIEVEETTETIMRDRVLGIIRDHYNKWIELPEVPTEEEYNEKISTMNDKDIYIYSTQLALVNEYRTQFFQVNNLNYENTNYFFNYLQAHFDDFINHDTSSPINTPYGYFAFDENYYEVPYYIENNPEKGVTPLWNHFYATSGKMYIGFQNHKLTIYEKVVQPSSNCYCLTLIEDIGKEKASTPKPKHNMADIFYEAISESYELVGGEQ